jgi:hypothetical protein
VPACRVPRAEAVNGNCNRHRPSRFAERLLLTLHAQNVPCLLLDDGTVLNEGAAVLQALADKVRVCLPTVVGVGRRNGRVESRLEGSSLSRLLTHSLTHSPCIHPGARRVQADSRTEDERALPGPRRSELGGIRAACVVRPAVRPSLGRGQGVPAGARGEKVLHPERPAAQGQVFPCWQRLHHGEVVANNLQTAMPISSSAGLATSAWT